MAIGELLFSISFGGVLIVVGIVSKLLLDRIYTK